MGLIDDELAEVKKLCEHVIPGARLVSCVKTMVRAEIKRTEFKKIVTCIQFPENYPCNLLLIELKSKTLSTKLLDRLTNVCEQEVKKLLGKPQIIKVIQFIKTFLDENPLCCCYDEINALKKCLDLQKDELKLKQKLSSVVFRMVNAQYYLNTRVYVPEDYPSACIKLDDVDTNFPPAFFRHIYAQGQEIARRCIEPPLKKQKPNDPPFTPSPSLQKTISFFIDCIKKLPNQECQICKNQCFPEDASTLEYDENSPKYIERVLCGHLYHLECLLVYMKTPPFGNKKCPCGMKISHHKWRLTDKLAEDRWAHEQARGRELAEVEDFFK